MQTGGTSGMGLGLIPLLRCSNIIRQGTTCDRFSVCLLLFTLFLAPLTHAIDSAQWEIHPVLVEDGLPDSTVFSIVQDRTGFIWFGTTNGIARYDGYEFRLFQHDPNNIQTISSNNAGNLFVDSRNRLWIGTFGGGLNRIDLNSGELTVFPYTGDTDEIRVSENVQTLFEDRDGTVWIGTANGLFNITSDDRISFYGHDPDDTSSLSHPRVWDILQATDGSYWVGTSNGLSQLKPGQTGFTNHYLPAEIQTEDSADEFRTLLQDRSGNIWIGSSTGLHSFDPVSQEFRRYTPHDSGIKINRIESIQAGRMLIATNNGVYDFDMNRRVFGRDENDNSIWHIFPDRDIRDILKDESGLLWLSTRYSGVLKIDISGNPITHHNRYLADDPDHLKFKRVWAIEKDIDGTLYLGTAEGVVMKTASGEYERVLMADGDVIPGVIRSMHKAADDGLWIGSTRGLFYRDKQSGETTEVPAPFDLVGLSPTNIYAIEETRSGEIWLGLFNYGVLRWQPDSGVAELIQDYDQGTLTYLNVRAVYEDSLGTIWIGTSLGGLFRYDPASGDIRVYIHDPKNPDSIAANRVRTIHEDTSGRLWVATFKGLDQYNRQSGKFSHVTTGDGLLSNSIQSILEDSEEILWIGTQFGISRFDPETRDIINFGASFGIQNQGLNARSALIDEKDHLYFGSVNGYYDFSQDHVAYVNPYNPPVTITDIYINNLPLEFERVVQVPEVLELNHQARELAIEFSALDYKSPDQNRYLFRVSGLYDDWIDASKTRRLIMSGIEPGEYRVEIKGSNSDGRWSEQQVGLSIQVSPAWWDRGWVKSLLTLAVVLLVLAFYKYRTFNIRRRNQELEREVACRTADLQRLNEQLAASADTDYLTGLPNRLAFIRSFSELRDALDTEHIPICVVLADVDHFKQINDEYGHEAGDAVLKQVGTLFKTILREEDMVARWGGEEFAFYLVDTDERQAWEITERIRESMQNLAILYQKESIQLTATFGICQYHPDMSLEACIRRADDSLYKGKSRGRNIVVVHKEDFGS